jgi:hypothetical protein
LRHAQAALATLQEQLYSEAEALEAEARLATKQAAVQHWEVGQATYRAHLETLALALHPCGVATTAPQTSAQVVTQLQNAVEAIDMFAQQYLLPSQQATLSKVRKQLPALAALGDVWWRAVQQA